MTLLSMLFVMSSCHFVDVQHFLKDIDVNEIDSVIISEFGYWNILMKDRITIDSNIIFKKEELPNKLLNDFSIIFNNLEQSEGYYIKNDSSFFNMFLFYKDKFICVRKYGPDSYAASIYIRKIDEQGFPYDFKNVTYSNIFNYSHKYIPEFISLLNQLVKINNVRTGKQIKLLNFNNNYELRDN